ncbi:unnamed protein product [Brassica rapa subsp. narinosa]
MMMMPSTPLAWRFDSAEFTLKEDYNDFFLNECFLMSQEAFILQIKY